MNTHWLSCCTSPGTDLTEAVKKWRKKRDSEKLRWGGVGSVMEKPPPPPPPPPPPQKHSVFVTYSWRGRWGIVLSWLRRRGYYIQINKETGLANLRRKCLWREESAGHTQQEKRATVDIFGTNCQHSHSDPRKGLSSLCASTGKGLAVPVGHWGPYHGCVHGEQHTLTLGFTHSLHWRHVWNLWKS